MRHFLGPPTDFSSDLADFSDFGSIFLVCSRARFSCKAFTRLSLFLWNAAHFLWPSPLAGRKSAQNEETASRFCRSSLNQSTEAICRGVKCRDFRWVAALGFVKALNGLTSLLRNQHTAE